MEPFPIPAPSFTGESRTVPAGNAFDWLRQGWALFAAQPGQWLVLTVVLLVAMLALSIVPLIGTLVANMLTPLFMAGMLYASRRVAEGEVPALGDLFVAFGKGGGNLALVGLLYMAGMFLIFVVSVTLGGGGAMGGLMTGRPAGIGLAFGSVLFAMMLSMVLSIPLFMALWFAPALVFFNRMAPLAAFKASFDACVKNALPFLVYGLIVLVLSFFAALPLCLGFLLLLPVISGSVYASYRDIFVAD